MSMTTHWFLSFSNVTWISFLSLAAVLMWVTAFDVHIVDCYQSQFYMQALQESRSSRLGGTITESPAEGDGVDLSPGPETPATVPTSSTGHQPPAPMPSAPQSLPSATTSLSGVEVEVSRSFSAVSLM